MSNHGHDRHESEPTSDPHPPVGPGGEAVVGWRARFGNWLRDTAGTAKQAFSKDEHPTRREFLKFGAAGGIGVGLYKAFQMVGSTSDTGDNDEIQKVGGLSDEEWNRMTKEQQRDFAEGVKQSEKRIGDEMTKVAAKKQQNKENPEFLAEALRLPMLEAAGALVQQLAVGAHGLVRLYEPSGERGEGLDTWGNKGMVMPPSGHTTSAELQKTINALENLQKSLGLWIDGIEVSETVLLKLYQAGIAYEDLCMIYSTVAGLDVKNATKAAGKAAGLYAWYRAIRLRHGMNLYYDREKDSVLATRFKAAIGESIQRFKDAKHHIEVEEKAAADAEKAKAAADAQRAHEVALAQAGAKPEFKITTGGPAAGASPSVPPPSSGGAGHHA